MPGIWRWLARDAEQFPAGRLVQPSGDVPNLQMQIPARQATGRAGQRFLLWLDAVGGFLVCLADRVSIGQPVARRVDVPIMADLARLHAWIERRGDGYSLRAARSATVNGRVVKQRATLSDDARVLLGRDVQLRFSRPSCRSRTARLRLESPHRLSLATNEVLLMADTCTIGPGPSAHVRAAGWNREIVMCRNGTELWIHAAAPFQVDGRRCVESSRLTLASRVEGDGFSLALEPLSD